MGPSAIFIKCGDGPSTPLELLLYSPGMLHVTEDYAAFNKPTVLTRSKTLGFIILI